MELVGNISALWRDDKDSLTYSALIQRIQDSASSKIPITAFVGGGLSIQAGYPSSNELIDYLIHEANIDPLEINALDGFPVKAKRIKELIEQRGESFYEILYRRFNEKNFQINPTIPLYEDLVNIPFNSFITTNYDSCIEEAAKREGIQIHDIQKYPRLIADNLSIKKVYHIHGKIDLNDINTSSKTLVLTSDNYDEAYGDSSRLPILMSAIFDCQDILFVGFGLEEATLFRLLESSKKRDEKDLINENGENPPSNKHYKLTILPIERDLLNAPRTPDEIERYENTIIEQDQYLLKKYKIVAIRYKADKNFSEIKRIVRDIYERTRVSTTEVKLDLMNTGVQA